MNKVAVGESWLAILAFAILSVSSTASCAIDQAVTVSATVPEELYFTLSESGSGVTLSSIYPGPGLGAGSASIFSTGMWVLSVKDGTAGGDGKMKSGTKSLSKIFEVALGSKGYKNLPGNTGSQVMEIKAPGTYSYPTGYRQQFTSGDYAGVYSIGISWICSATF